jgi:hypothetical protein
MVSDKEYDKSESVESFAGFGCSVGKSVLASYRQSQLMELDRTGLWMDGWTACLRLYGLDWTAWCSGPDCAIIGVQVHPVRLDIYISWCCDCSNRQCA